MLLHLDWWGGCTDNPSHVELKGHCTVFAIERRGYRSLPFLNWNLHLLFLAYNFRDLIRQPVGTMASTADPRLAAYLVVMAKLAEEQDLTEDIRGEVRGLSISFTVLAFLFVVLRYGAKYKQGGKYALDDWLLGVATVFLVGNTALLCTSMFCLLYSVVILTRIVLNFGLGRHSATVAAEPNGLNNAMMVGKVSLYNPTEGRSSLTNHKSFS